MSSDATVDATGCVGNTIKVASGHYFDLANPQPEDVDLFSIAWALSHTSRFGGHSPRYYSVAEHSVRAMSLREVESTELRKAILMHDAAEAYCGDLVKPLKNLLPEFSVIEDRIQSAIAKHFSIDFARYESSIKLIDRIMLKSEQVGLWPSDDREWTGLGDVLPEAWPIGTWRPEEACIQFLSQAKRLELRDAHLAWGQFCARQKINGGARG